MGALMCQQPLLKPLPQPELHSARLNHLLRALPDVDFDFMARHLEPITFRLGESIYEPGIPLQYAIFPTTSIVSLHYVTARGASAETAAVGKEGMVGLALFMGGDTTGSSARVLVAGGAVRLPADQLRQTFESVPAARVAAASHPVAYRPNHAIGCLQPAPPHRAAVLPLVAVHPRPLAVERPGDDARARLRHAGRASGSISEVAVRLQQAGVIRYRRGHISVLDRAGLEHRACECYAAVNREQGRLLAPTPGTKGLNATPSTTVSLQPASCPTCTPNLASEDGWFKSTYSRRWGSDWLATF